MGSADSGESVDILGDPEMSECKPRIDAAEREADQTASAYIMFFEQPGQNGTDGLGSGFYTVSEIIDDGQEVDIALVVVSFEVLGVVVEILFEEAAADVVGEDEGARHASIII